MLRISRFRLPSPYRYGVQTISFSCRLIIFRKPGTSDSLEPYPTHLPSQGLSHPYESAFDSRCSFYLLKDSLDQDCLISKSFPEFTWFFPAHYCTGETSNLSLEEANISNSVADKPFPLILTISLWCSDHITSLQTHHLRGTQRFRPTRALLYLLTITEHVSSL